MEIRHLQALTAISDHGTFSAAAEHLNTVQSNISAHVARLERELGTPLIDRADGRLTEEGTVVVARARRILGAELPPVQRRWEGVYAQCADGGVCLREEIRPGVFIVTGPGGRGMTCAPAIAADTLKAAGVVA